MSGLSNVGGDCRSSDRMRSMLNSVTFACYTSFGLSSAFSDGFRFREGDPSCTEAFVVFLPMIRHIVHNFWHGQVQLNNSARYNECNQHSPEGLACRDCVASHPYFDTNV